MTLGDYLDEHPGHKLEGLTFVVPQRYVRRGVVPQQEMRLRSGWSMGHGMMGLWFQLPRSYPTGQIWPITGVSYADALLHWKVLVPVSA